MYRIMKTNFSEIYGTVATGLLLSCEQKVYKLLKSINIYYLELILLEKGHVRCFNSSIFKALLFIKEYVYTSM